MTSFGRPTGISSGHRFEYPESSLLRAWRCWWRCQDGHAGTKGVCGRDVKMIAPLFDLPHTIPQPETTKRNICSDFGPFLRPGFAPFTGVGFCRDRRKDLLRDPYPPAPFPARGERGVQTGETAAFWLKIGGTEKPTLEKDFRGVHPRLGENAPDGRTYGADA